MKAENVYIENIDWANIDITDDDLEMLVNYLIEHEKPETIKNLTKVFIQNRILVEKQKQKEKISKIGSIFYPRETYIINQELVFPADNWKSGKVISIRDGINPEIPPFSVMLVEFLDGTKREFAMNLSNHILNSSSQTEPDQNLDETNIENKYFSKISIKLEKELELNNVLTRIGKEWFPSSLLIDFHQGDLNIAEAILDMHGGGPLSTLEIIKQMDKDAQNNVELLEFSLNQALSEDQRFDEVGVEGVFSWYLRRNEPEFVRQKPLFLQFDSNDLSVNDMSEEDIQIISGIDDELITLDINQEQNVFDNTSFTLIYPHWRVGSIPLTPSIQKIFPSALETNRVKIKIIDKNSGDEISAWIVRPYYFVYGLKEWYEESELMPGSVVNLSKGTEPGVIFIEPQKKRSNREWIKTVLVGVDGGIVIALLKQPITAGFSERMAYSITDVDAIDQIWKSQSQKSKPIKNDVVKMMSELSKLNQQKNVHFLELYAAINIIRRCTPEVLLNLLKAGTEFSYVGDHYFHINETR